MPDAPFNLYQRRVAEARGLNLRLTEFRQRQLIGQLEEYEELLVRALRAGGATNAQLSRLSSVRAALDLMNRHIETATRNTINLSARQMARLQAEATVGLMESFGISTAGVEASFDALGLQAAQAMLSRSQLAGTFKTLRSGVVKDVDRILISAAARGASTQEVERQLRVYVRGAEAIPQELLDDRRRIGKEALKKFLGYAAPTSADVEAVRQQAKKVVRKTSLIARHEAVNAGHEVAASAAADSPVVKAIQWNLSSRHPEPDGCDILADQDLYGMGDGVYPATAVPGLLHPRCLCWISHVLFDPGEFGNEKPEPELQANLDNLADEHDLSPSKKRELANSVAIGEARRPAVQEAAKEATFKVAVEAGVKAVQALGSTQKDATQNVARLLASTAVSGAAGHRAMNKFLKRTALAQSLTPPGPALKLGLDEHFIISPLAKLPATLPPMFRKGLPGMPANVQAKRLDENLEIAAEWLGRQGHEHLFHFAADGTPLFAIQGKWNEVPIPNSLYTKFAGGWTIHNHPVLHDWSFSLVDLKKSHWTRSAGEALVTRRYIHTLQPTKTPTFRLRDFYFGKTQYELARGKRAVERLKRGEISDKDIEKAPWYAETKVGKPETKLPPINPTSTQELFDSWGTLAQRDRLGGNQRYKVLDRMFTERLQQEYKVLPAATVEKLRSGKELDELVEKLLQANLAEELKAFGRPLERKFISHEEFTELKRRLTLQQWANEMGYRYTVKARTTPYIGTQFERPISRRKWRKLGETVEGDADQSAIPEWIYEDLEVSVTKPWVSLGLEAVDDKLATSGVTKAYTDQLRQLEHWFGDLLPASRPPIFPAAGLLDDHLEILRPWHHRQSVESAFNFNEFGEQVFMRQGTMDAVDFSYDDLRAMARHRHVHNHPHGTPPSLEDVRIMAQARWESVHINGPKGTSYTLKRNPDFWEWDDEVADYILKRNRSGTPPSEWSFAEVAIVRAMRRNHAKHKGVDVPYEPTKVGFREIFGFVPGAWGEGMTFKRSPILGFQDFSTKWRVTSQRVQDRMTQREYLVLRDNDFLRLPPAAVARKPESGLDQRWVVGPTGQTQLSVKVSLREVGQEAESDFLLLLDKDGSWVVRDGDRFKKVINQTEAGTIWRERTLKEVGDHYGMTIEKHSTIPYTGPRQAPLPRGFSGNGAVPGSLDEGTGWFVKEKKPSLPHGQRYEMEYGYNVDDHLDYDNVVATLANALKNDFDLKLADGAKGGIPLHNTRALARALLPDEEDTEAWEKLRRIVVERMTPEESVDRVAHASELMQALRIFARTEPEIGKRHQKLFESGLMGDSNSLFRPLAKIEVIERLTEKLVQSEIDTVLGPATEWAKLAPGQMRERVRNLISKLSALNIEADRFSWTHHVEGVTRPGGQQVHYAKWLFGLEWSDLGDVGDWNRIKGLLERIPHMAQPQQPVGGSATWPWLAGAADEDRAGWLLSAYGKQVRLAPGGTTLVERMTPPLTAGLTEAEQITLSRLFRDERSYFTFGRGKGPVFGASEPRVDLTDYIDEDQLSDLLAAISDVEKAVVKPALGIDGIERWDAEAFTKALLDAGNTAGSVQDALRAEADKLYSGMLIEIRQKAHAQLLKSLEKAIPADGLHPRGIFGRNLVNAIADSPGGNATRHNLQRVANLLVKNSDEIRARFKAIKAAKDNLTQELIEDSVEHTFLKKRADAFYELWSHYQSGTLLPRDPMPLSRAQLGRELYEEMTKWQLRIQDAKQKTANVSAVLLDVEARDRLYQETADLIRQLDMERIRSANTLNFYLEDVAKKAQKLQEDRLATLIEAIEIDWPMISALGEEVLDLPQLVDRKLLATIARQFGPNAEYVTVLELADYVNPRIPTIFELISGGAADQIPLPLPRYADFMVETFGMHRITELHDRMLRYVRLRALADGIEDSFTKPLREAVAGVSSVNQMLTSKNLKAPWRDFVTHPSDLNDLNRLVNEIANLEDKTSGVLKQWARTASEHPNSLVLQTLARDEIPKVMAELYGDDVAKILVDRWGLRQADFDHVYQSDELFSDLNLYSIGDEAVEEVYGSVERWMDEFMEAEDISDFIDVKERVDDLAKEMFQEEQSQWLDDLRDEFLREWSGSVRWRDAETIWDVARDQFDDRRYSYSSVYGRLDDELLERIEQQGFDIAELISEAQEYLFRTQRDDAWSEWFDDRWISIEDFIEEHIEEFTDLDDVVAWATDQAREQAIQLISEDATLEWREWALKTLIDQQLDSDWGGSVRFMLGEMYRDTQAYLDRLLPDSADLIPIFRGWRLDPASAEEMASPWGWIEWSGHMPLSSWTISPFEAVTFANYDNLGPNNWPEGFRRLVSVALIDRRRLLTTPRTGLGCLTEGECLMLGGSARTINYLGADDAYKIRPFDFMVNLRDIGLINDTDWEKYIELFDLNISNANYFDGRPAGTSRLWLTGEKFKLGKVPAETIVNRNLVDEIEGMVRDLFLPDYHTGDEVVQRLGSLAEILVNSGMDEYIRTHYPEQYVALIARQAFAEQLADAKGITVARLANELNELIQEHRDIYTEFFTDRWAY